MQTKGGKVRFRIFAKNFRGYRKLNFELCNVNFIVGDNSSGKTSLLYLIEALFSRDFLKSHSIIGATSKLSTAADILSPYIEDSEVTVGFIGEEQNNSDDAEERKAVGKIVSYVTDKRRQNISIDRTLAISGDNAKVVRRRAGKLYSKNIQLNTLKSILFSAVREVLFPTKGYSKSKLPDHIEGTKIAWELAFFDFNESERSVSMPYFLGDGPIFVRMYGPIRLDPRGIYNKTSDQEKYKGDHIPHKLNDLFESGGEKKKYLKNHINYFGQESGLFDEIVVSKYKLTDIRSPIKIEIKKNGKKFSIDDVGYGVSQVLPIIVDAILLSSEEDSLIIVQQPELHLHPKAQAAFGELVYNLSKEGLRFFIETHSDYIIDRYRYCCFKGAVDESKEFNSQILFCVNDAKGNSISKVPISKNGKILKSPPEYRDFFFREEDKIFEMV